MNFLEQFWEEIRSGRIRNFPNPVPLNVNLALTVMLPDRQNHLVYQPHNMTGICYQDHEQFVNVFAFYRGVILTGAELSHGTDLYKPKTEQDFMRAMYHKSWDIEMDIEANRESLGPDATAADYILQMYSFAAWLRYFNSTVHVNH